MVDFSIAQMLDTCKDCQIQLIQCVSARRNDQHLHKCVDEWHTAVFKLEKRELLVMALLYIRIA